MTTEPPVGAAAGSHLDLERLAELDEDLLDPQENARATAHLAGCARCREARSRLQGTRTLLAALPDEPMPDEVAARLDAAFESAAGPATIVPLTPRRRPWRSHPTAAGLGAAATIVALVAAVVLGTTLHNSSDNPSQDQETRPEAGAAPTLQFTRVVSDDTYTKANTAHLVTGLIRPSSAAIAGKGSSDAGTSPSPGNPPPAGTATGAAAIDPALQPLYNDPTLMQECVNQLSGATTTDPPLVVAFAHWTDKANSVRNVPVAVIVLPGIRAGRDDAWIVGPQCVSAPDNNLYLYQSVPSTP